MTRSPAKTNLFLEVPAKRPDGFHELDTVFVELELADSVTVEANEGIELSVVGDPQIPTDERNLAWKAVDALRQAASRPDLGARVTIEKRIPAGGGLGGGSSNAAATLRACRELWGLDGVSDDQLHAVAAELGSDVAFFLRGGLQRGRGRGELLFPLAPLPSPLHLVLVFPPFGCSTPAVYKALAPHLPETPRDAQELIDLLPSGDVDAIGAALFNRLEAAAFDHAPQLRDLHADLGQREGVVRCLLSGSGSTLLCLMGDANTANALQAQLTAEDSRAVATRTASSRM